MGILPVGHGLDHRRGESQRAEASAWEEVWLGQEGLNPWTWGGGLKSTAGLTLRARVSQGGHVASVSLRVSLSLEQARPVVLALVSEAALRCSLLIFFFLKEKQEKKDRSDTDFKTKAGNEH